MTTTPPTDPETLTVLLDRGLSTRSRYGHVALLLASVVMSLVLLSLLATEPDLPSRTQIVFGLMLLISLAWTAYSIWTLKYRWTLHVQHRVVAGVIALIASLAFTGSAGVIGLTTQQTAAWAAASSGLFMIALSGLALGNACQSRRALQRRAAELRSSLNAD